MRAEVSTAERVATTNRITAACAELEPWLKYTSALYFSVMTLTSIGYGAMLPPASNSSEMFLCVVLMMVSSMIWVYTMGQMCAIATSMDPDTTAFHNNMDALNAFMRERGLQTDLRVRCRTFFHATRKMATLTDDSELLEKMSPLLRGTVALETHRSWLSRFFVAVSTNLAARLPSKPPTRTQSVTLRLTC